MKDFDFQSDGWGTDDGFNDNTQSDGFSNDSEDLSFLDDDSEDLSFLDDGFNSNTPNDRGMSSSPQRGRSDDMFAETMRKPMDSGVGGYDRADAFVETMNGGGNPQQGNPSNGGYGKPSPFMDNVMMQQQQQQQQGYSDGFSNNGGMNGSKPPKEVNLSNKTVGVLLCVVLVVLALVIYGVSKIDFTKEKAPQQANKPTVEATQTTKPAKTENSGGKTDALKEIPSSMALDYTGEVYKAEGVVTSKSRYLNGTQVLHSIDITLMFGSQTEVVSYYTTIDTYTQVQIGDKLQIGYQTPQEGYITLTSVTY